MNKEIKRKIILTLIGTIGMISLIVGVSFTQFSVDLSGRQIQSINTGCLKIEMRDNGSLILNDSYPLSDDEGLSSSPYIYTIENICNVDAFYETTINVINDSNLDNVSKVKVALDGDSYLKPTIESNLPSATLLENEASVKKTYKLDEGFLRVGERKTFNLRTWIDYDVNQITGKIENKVIINSEARNNNTLVYKTNSAGYFSGSRQTVLKNVKYEDPVQNGIVEVKDRDDTKYFYRGNLNNYITFGTYNSALAAHSKGDSINWKVLSSNSDGSINLILDDAIGSSSYTNVDNILTSFYNTHLQDEEAYIKLDSTFCKEGATNGEYLAKVRVDNNNPTSKCNGSNTFTKIGLPTVDEIIYAGINSSYLNPNILTGTLESSSNVYQLTSTGLKEISKSASSEIRPVITLKKEVKLSGSGTVSEPFYVNGLYTDDKQSNDTEKPVIVSARVDEKWSKENKTIEINAKDNNTISGYLVKNNNTIPEANDSSWEASSSTKYTTVNTYDNGTYYVFVKDENGNVSDGEKVVIERVDRVNPTCTIRVNAAQDKTDFKTLTIESEDTNIDLKGYSWENREDTTSVIKVEENGLYTAYLTDLAGNKGSCSVTVTDIKSYTVNVVVNNGTLDGQTTASVKPGRNASFTINPSNVEDEGLVSCTNNQTGTIENNTLTVSNVTSDTTCTVTYAPNMTTLFTDGTLIINEKPSDREANITEHGAVTKEYAALSNSNQYVFDYYSSQLWYSQGLSIKSVEIGQKIEPTDTKYWFYNLNNMATGDFTNLDTKNVTSMHSMFYRAGYNSSVTSFILIGLDNWDTSKVISIFTMFESAGRSASTWSVGDLSNWDTSSVTSMSYMFYQAGENATTWSVGDLSNWDTANVTSMVAMFKDAGRNATTWSIGNLSNWDTSKVTTMSQMFYSAGRSATTFDIGDLSDWDTSNVKSMSNMFNYAGYNAQTFNIGNLSNWDTSSVTSMSYMFNYAGYKATTWGIGDLSNWDTSQVTDMSYMFYDAGWDATVWSIGNLSSWDTSSVTDMSVMFSGAGYNTITWSIGDLSSWDTSKVTNMSSMFSSAGYSSTTWNIGDLSNWDTSKVTDMSSMFKDAGRNATTWSIGDLSDWDVSNVTNMASMFSEAGYSATTFELNLSNWNTLKVTSMYQMFYRAGYSATTWSIGNLSNWNTSKVTDMRSMFWAAGYNATTWNNIGTLKIYAKYISQMFAACTKAKATLNIYSNPASGSSGYNQAFLNAATASNALITVNYSSATTNIDDIIATGSGNVVKGVQLD